MKSRIAITFQAVLFAILAHALLAAALRAESVSVDFGKQTATSSYLIFGGCSPNPAHTKAWDLLAKAGITFLRFDVKFGAHPDPKNIALDDYRSSMGKPGTVADINSKYWNWSRMDGDVALCQKRGLKSMAIVCYSGTFQPFRQSDHQQNRHGLPA